MLCASDASTQSVVANGSLEDTAHGGKLMAQQTPVESIALNPRKKQKFRLAEKHVLSRNVQRYRFELHSTQQRLGLPVGKHVYIYGK